MGGLHRGSPAVALVIAYGAVTLLFAVTFVASRAVDRPMEYFAQDPTETIDAPAYLGVLSSVVALLWAATAACCVLGWLGTGRGWRSPFLWSALFVGLVLADDVFRLHESYYPSLRLSQTVVFASYAVIGLAYMWFLRGFLRAHAWWIFLIGFALLALSAGTDEVLKARAPFLLEEGAKPFGVASWLVFYGSATLTHLAPRDREDAPAHV